jgi:L-lactate utilization protein LutC
MLVALTGPSQSLDLDLLPAIGIHGPRRIHVILVNESQALSPNRRARVY